MSEFCNFVETRANACKPILPLTHVCDAFCFREIRQKEMLQKHKCSVFEGEELLYLFYGKPFYRPQNSDKANSLKAYLPVCIVLDSVKLPAPKRIAPFDSGGFGMYLSHMHPAMTVTNFLLSPGSLDKAAKIVCAFYQSNKLYFQGDPKDIEIPPSEFEVECYYSLIKEKSLTRCDDRKRAIELQLEDSIMLNSETVLMVVLPQVFLDDDKIKELITTKWSAVVESYNIHHSNPNEYHALIYEKVEKFLEKEGYF